jgi:hypothetical protein
MLAKGRLGEVTQTLRFNKGEILNVFEREDRSYRLALLCTHWIRDVERYAPNAATLARNLHIQVDGKWISDADLAEMLEHPMKREMLSSDFMLTYLHTLIRAPFELLSDYCEDYDRAVSGGALLSQMKSAPWYGVAYIVRNAVSHNFHIEAGRLRDKLPIRWRTITITKEMEGQPMTAAFFFFWHKPGYELFLEMQTFADAMPALG